MPVPIIRYPIDPTGISPNNRVLGEIHTLSAKPLRAVAPTYGAFFSQSIVVYDHSSDRLLIKNVDYSCVELLQEATLKYGKEIVLIILITNPDVSSVVRINYQVLGGYYQNNASGVISLYETAIIDNRPINWINILQKPLEYPPTIHTHLLDDVVGFEPVISALERVRNAIILSDIPAFEELITWVNDSVEEVTTVIENRITDLEVFTQSVQVDTKDYIGLGEVVNLPIITEEEAINVVSVVKYVTQDRLLDTLEHYFTPEKVTIDKEVVGLEKVVNLPLATIETINQIEPTQTYITHEMLLEQLKLYSLIGNEPLTKDDIGLNEVINLPLTTTEDIQNNIPTQTYVTHAKLLELLASYQLITPDSKPILPDNTITLIPHVYSINEGSVLNVMVETQGIADGSIYYWTIDCIDCTNEDFSTTAGQVTIYSNTGLFSVVTKYDTVNDSNESFRIQLHANSPAGITIASTPLIVIKDLPIYIPETNAINARMYLASTMGSSLDLFKEKCTPKRWFMQLMDQSVDPPHPPPIPSKTWVGPNLDPIIPISPSSLHIKAQAFINLKPPTLINHPFNLYLHYQLKPYRKLSLSKAIPEVIRNYQPKDLVKAMMGFEPLHYNGYQLFNLSKIPTYHTRLIRNHLPGYNGKFNAKTLMRSLPDYPIKEYNPRVLWTQHTQRLVRIGTDVVIPETPVVKLPTTAKLGVIQTVDYPKNTHDLFWYQANSKDLKINQILPRLYYIYSTGYSAKHLFQEQFTKPLNFTARKLLNSKTRS